MLSRKLTCHLCLVLTVITSILVGSCSTTENEQDLEQIDPEKIPPGEKLTDLVVSYELGPFVRDRFPWGSTALVWAKTFHNGTIVGMRKIYQVWDYNLDGRIDLAAKLNEYGGVAQVVFDFDLDGVPDGQSKAP